MRFMETCEMPDKTSPEYLIKEIKAFREFYMTRPTVNAAHRPPTMAEMTRSEAEHLMDFLERLDKCMKTLSKFEG